MIELTRYYEEFSRYFDMAEDQQRRCNLGSEPHANSTEDDLMNKVHLYDVVERKYAGFSQIINDIFYAKTEAHPYYEKIQDGTCVSVRKYMVDSWDGKQKLFDLPEWLYIFILHRVCGSAINYAQNPSGYHNTILFDLHQCDSIEEMTRLIPTYNKTFYTSIGYQFPKFPKPPSSKYKRGGDYFLVEYAPRLAREMAEWLVQGDKKDFREMGEFMFEWNKQNGLSAYRFQYAAVLADIADWYPQYVNRESLFYYGTNAIECISYLATPTERVKKEKLLDAVMLHILEDKNSLPYNAEDVCCDFIRWIENYVRPGGHYKHVNLDTVWNSSIITDHPFGRQKAMLDLNLVPTFNQMKHHPSDDMVLKMHDMSPEEYKEKCQSLQIA